MAGQVERDFPLGHPAASDYDPGSPEAREWARRNIHPRGERDFPVDHPKAVDTPDNQNSVAVLPGVDPDQPELEPFTGRTPAQAKAAREFYESLLPTVAESPVAEPVVAANPPAVVGKARAFKHGTEGGV